MNKTDELLIETVEVYKDRTQIGMNLMTKMEDIKPILEVEENTVIFDAKTENRIYQLLKNEENN